MSVTEKPALPTIASVDRADAHVGKLMSDLEGITMAVERFAGDDVSLEDAVFMTEAGIAVGQPRRDAEPATFARLLVFADELLGDTEQIAELAQRLRSALLLSYREAVIEGGAEEARDG
jgi:hypothetical protein